MRAMLVLLLSGGLLLGCKHSKPSDPAGMDASGSKRRTEKPGARSTGRESGARSERAVPLHEPVGKVASVNAGLRFVVVDFAFNPLPQEEQRMGVYRDGQKVGEVKISGQARNSIIAADVTAGEAKVGDEVRP